VLGFRSKGNWLPTVIASSVASIVAYHFVGEPWHVSIGALAGIAVASALPLKASPDLLTEPEVP
jgi:predicted branched-subunit amino acid permease